ncbi:hypothetical protein V8C37DRAFT_108090 [Trichoderma ceciliae]
MLHVTLNHVCFASWVCIIGCKKLGRKIERLEKWRHGADMTCSYLVVRPSQSLSVMGQCSLCEGELKGEEVNEAEVPKKAGKSRRNRLQGESRPTARKAVEERSQATIPSSPPLSLSFLLLLFFFSYPLLVFCSQYVLSLRGGHGKFIFLVWAKKLSDEPPLLATIENVMKKRTAIPPFEGIFSLLYRSASSPVGLTNERIETRLDNMSPINLCMACPGALVTNTAMSTPYVMSSAFRYGRPCSFR